MGKRRARARTAHTGRRGRAVPSHREGTTAAPWRIEADIAELRDKLGEDVLVHVVRCLAAIDRTTSLHHLYVATDENVSEVAAARNSLVVFVWAVSAVHEAHKALNDLAGTGVKGRLTWAHDYWGMLDDLRKRWDREPFSTIRNKAGFHLDAGLVRAGIETTEARLREAGEPFIVATGSDRRPMNTSFVGASEIVVAGLWGSTSEAELVALLQQVLADVQALQIGISAVLADLMGVGGEDREGTAEPD